MSVQTYNPAFVDLIVGGAKISGYTDGTYISFVRSEDSFEDETGADGYTSRSKTNNTSGDLTITLQQTSLSNADLTAIANIDEVTGEGVIPVIIKERNTGNSIVSASAWIKKPADINYSKSIEPRNWLLKLASVRQGISGNPLQ